RRVTAVMSFLYGQNPCPAPPAPEPVARPIPAPAGGPAPAARSGDRVTTGAAPVVARSPDRAPPLEQPKTLTATHPGHISATLVHMYQGGTNIDLKTALARYVEEAAAQAPHFDGHVALVLDASASTLGYGERQFCCVSQSQALRLVMERCCARLSVHTVG